MAVFAKEVVGRDVVDLHNEKLGELTDFVIDKSSGSVTQIVVLLEANLDPTMLPWNFRDGSSNWSKGGKGCPNESHFCAYEKCRHFCL